MLRLSPKPIVGAVALALGTTSMASLAQEAEQRRDLGQLEEIVVTGTMRRASQQDVPIAISTVTEADLARTFVNDVRALDRITPGLVLSAPAGFNATGGGMRGTGTNIILVTQDAPVSFLMDEFALSHVTSQFLTLFDVQQIEVYRGPQGTLFGKNSTGGVISITSKRPVMDEFSADFEVGYGQYQNGAGNRSVKAALNIPFAENLAFRLASIYDQSDGYYKADKATATFPNQVPLWGLFGIPEGTLPPEEVGLAVAGNGRRLGGKDVMATKAKLLWEPTENYSAYLIFENVRDRSDSPPGVNESTEADLLTQLGFPGIQLAGQRDVFSTLITGNDDIRMDAGHRVDANGLYLTQTLALGAGEITSITGYREERQRLPSTYTGEAFRTLFDSSRHTERYTFQQELRFASLLDGPFNFVLGANYFKDSFNFRSFYQVGLTSLIPVFDPETESFVRADGRVNLDTRDLRDYQLQGTEQDRDEYALFFDGTFEVTDRLNLTAGIRFSRDEKDYVRFVDGGGLCSEFTEPQDIIFVDGVCRDVRSQMISRAGISAREWDGNSVPLPPENFGVFLNASDSWNETTWRTVLDYRLNDDQMVYLSYATGFLSGGFSETCATVEFCSYDPETNDNIEIGYKADLLDARLRLNIAAFRTQYDDLQRAVVAPYVAADGSNQQETVTVNTGRSEVKGIDVEATWVPTDNWRITAAVNWLDHKYKRGVLPALRGAGEEISLLDFDVPFSPEWKLMGSAAYEFGLRNGQRVTLTGAANYQSKAETDVFNAPGTQMDSRTLVDVSATLHDRRDRWALTGYISNLTNETYRFSALPVAGLWNFTNYGPPRSYGVTLSVRFE
ncbi:MAG: TonB-dependent receptor [Gammaproteobacteria bacterium]|nr:TonB-dependent receptor [Gammaproteobacteria bacterium]TVS15404.1 MAG: TonB-dependent receptor [Gammaproteobacteria bacterium]